MRKRLFNWQGQLFAYVWLEGNPGQSLERQSENMFASAAVELSSVGLSLDHVVRTRVFGTTRAARDAASSVRSRALKGQARAAGSSFISPRHFQSEADVALDLFAMAAPAGAVRKVTEHEPPQNFIRHLVWGPLVFLAGMTCEHRPTLEDQVADILPRAGALLRETECDWGNVVRASFFLHDTQNPAALLAAARQAAPIPLDHSEIEFVEGYSRPGKLIEIEITARR